MTEKLKKSYIIIFAEKNYAFYCKLLLIYIRCFLRKIVGKQSIIIHAWVKTSFFNIEYNNWGDDLNKFFYETATNGKVFFIPSTLKDYTKLPLPKHYICIGSILSFYNLDNAIICGGGVIDPRIRIIGTPQKVISVRGPRTRRCLIEQGIECPKCYGDPALLLPSVYSPFKKGVKNVVVIPHSSTDSLNPIIVDLKNKGCSVIGMNDYEKWTDIIDAIVDSEFVISESLHGLIVAEAYGIPSVWVEFQEHFDYWDFKFLDFYESIKKENQVSMKLYHNYNYDDIREVAMNWEKGQFDIATMINSFPFKYNNLKKD